MSNKELEESNRILLEKSKRDEKNLIKESEENDHNVELINDLSQAASEVHEENIRCKAEVNYWRQQCGWLSEKLNQNR